MLKSKIVKAIGTLALAGALILPAIPANAAGNHDGLQWVRDAYPGADYYQYNGDNTVTVYYGNSSFDVTCVEMIGDRCFVRK
ncbi:transcriptional regulator [Bacillus sp. M13(2017)]|uniref:transcriptional regulator n=1 Tax=Bacillus sp. M13(2017) TaxID=1958813 RepID=UPI0011328503|nr:transcriptional regulator [Bacillus sp. M13(2017)]